ncbi:GcrA family cell cycle regulator [Rhizobium sp. BT04]|uniref:GcrA family cell cycle regulator n=1 Tax=Rhizobium sp. BT04 TaxID=3045157 RepID=UPI0024B3CB18|nr:GcrA family cell cycle regulator [Rhizobium sp. BT04]
MFWTEARIELAEKMWRDGSSAARIAAEIGGVTRNAVLGIMNRKRDRFPLKSDNAAAPKRFRTAVVARPPRAAKPVKAPAPKIERPKPSAMLSDLGVRVDMPTRPSGPFQHRGVILDQSKVVPFVNVSSSSCRWPLTDFGDAGGPDMPCCGRQHRGGTSPDSAYCPEHASVSRGRA